MVQEIRCDSGGVAGIASERDKRARRCGSDILISERSEVSSSASAISFQPSGHKALLCKVHSWLDRNNSRAMAHVEQAADGFFAVGTIVERALIHIHADELVRHLRIEVAGELQDRKSTRL